MKFENNFFGFNDYGTIFTDIMIEPKEVPSPQNSTAPAPQHNTHQRYDQIDWERSLWDKEVLVMSDPGSAIENALTRLSAHFEALSIIDQARSAIRCAKYADGLKSIFVMDLDTLPSDGDAVPKLLHLRRANPGLTTIIVSSHFHHNDTTLERRAIADCSLRMPISDSELLRGMGLACRNTNLRLKGEFFS